MKPLNIFEEEIRMELIWVVPFWWPIRLCKVPRDHLTVPCSQTAELLLLHSQQPRSSFLASCQSPPSRLPSSLHGPSAPSPTESWKASAKLFITPISNVRRLPCPISITEKKRVNWNQGVWKPTYVLIHTVWQISSGLLFEDSYFLQSS